jgi:hypothetical protein
MLLCTIYILVGMAFTTTIIELVRSARLKGTVAGDGFFTIPSYPGQDTE